MATFRNPEEFANDLEALEAVERASMRYVSLGVYQILELAGAQFDQLDLSTADGDEKVDYLCEDLTRIALERIGGNSVPEARVFGAIDYKRAVYQFLPEFAIRQALLVDSKAEKDALNVARIQITQTSLCVRQIKQNVELQIQGLVPKIRELGNESFLTSTLFVKWHYKDVPDMQGRVKLARVTAFALPNGMLQDKYNPSTGDGIWNVGPDSPARQEKFRTRVNFTLLEQKAAWRVQRMTPGEPWEFQE